MRSTKCLKGYVGFDAQIIYYLCVLFLKHDQAKVLTHAAENTMYISQRGN